MPPPAPLTRVYRAGVLEREGFALDELAGYLDQPDCVVWADLCQPDAATAELVGRLLQLHDVAAEDLVTPGERPKLDRYATHLLLTAYATDLDTGDDELVTHELAAIVAERAVVVVCKDRGVDATRFTQRFDSSAGLAGSGVDFLVWGLLDVLVDSHLQVVDQLGAQIDDVEDRVFDDQVSSREAQRRSYELRRSITRLRQVAGPMRDVVGPLLHRDPQPGAGPMAPYLQDVYDHVLRVSESADSLREVVSDLFNTSINLQGNELNLISKKVTGWAAVVAVPTAITGFYGMNVPYPGSSSEVGFAIALALIVVGSLSLYLVFRARDWL